MSTEKSEYLQFGGLAVPEGVMMRSPHYYAVACRAPNGKIVVKTEALEQTWLSKVKWLKKPFLRGTLGLLDTMALGTRAMNYASSVQTDVRYGSTSPDGKPAKTYSKATEAALIAVTVVASIAIGLVIFKGIPEALTEAALGFNEKNGFAKNLVAGVIKMVFFIGYLALISRIPNVFEVFKYHGAEHKAINTIEAGLPLDVATCNQQTRLHPRCGTNFAIIVLLVGFFVFLLVPRYPMINGVQLNSIQAILFRFGLEILLLPLFAGISYEIIRWAGRRKNEKLVNIILKPGLATQYITTAEPVAKHIEVALVSLKAVLRAEESGDLHNSDDVDFAGLA